MEIVLGIVLFNDFGQKEILPVFVTLFRLIH